jgi:hypothetical protein
MTQYAVRTINGGYRITKFDENFNVTSVYDMPFHKGRLYCTCFQQQKPDCRHRMIVRMFNKRDLVNKGWMYDFEEQKFIRPKKVDIGL